MTVAEGLAMVVAGSGGLRVGIATAYGLAMTVEEGPRNDSWEGPRNGSRAGASE